MNTNEFEFSWGKKEEKVLELGTGDGYKTLPIQSELRRLT